MTFDDEHRVLELARDWKHGRLGSVHPSIARGLNCVLTRNGEEAVPFSRATDPSRPSLVDLVRAEYQRAPRVTSRSKSEAARRFVGQMSRSVHGGTNVSGR